MILICPEGIFLISFDYSIVIIGGPDGLVITELLDIIIIKVL